MTTASTSPATSRDPSGPGVQNVRGVRNRQDAAAISPWQIPTWPALVQVVLSLVVGIFSFVVVITMFALSIGLIPLFLVGLPLLLLTFAISRGIATLERGRIAALLGIRIAAPPVQQHSGFFARLRAEITSATQWKQLAYAVALGITGTVGAVLATATWGGALALLTLPAYASQLPSNGVIRFAGVASVIAWMACGLLLLGLAPFVTKLVAWLDLVVASSLLGPGRSAELEIRVDDLTRTRSAVVEAADAERRRIERDLHDGAQQRLVALAMNLGRARARIDEDPEGARMLMEEAHDDAKLALTELRDLARGLHPAVLSDRGLDAALSALGARSPIPVRLTVEVSERCAPSIEAVAYFVVSEALTNAAKHSGATEVSVTVRQVHDILHLQVHDDGRGGADINRGSGLAGLRDRVAAVDGTLQLQSPPGGPTVLEVRLPCAS